MGAINMDGKQRKSFGGCYPTSAAHDKARKA